MSTLKVSNFARQGYSIVFPLFLFFSAIFCMSTRTNNLLHLSILLLLLSLVRQENRQALAGVLREQWQTWTLLAAFFIYYALSNVWGHTPQHIDSPITHGVYLTGYLLLMTMLLRDGRTRRLAMLAVVGGITVLSLWTLIIDHTLVLTERAVSPENPGPTNVIDLAGYCGIGILICGMLLKEKASHWLYLPVVIMLVMLLLTQAAADHRPGAGGRLYAAPARLHPPQPADRRGAGRAGSAAFGHDAGGRHAARPFRGAGHPKRAAPEHLAPYAVGDGQPAVAGARFQL